MNSSCTINCEMNVQTETTDAVIAHLLYTYSRFIIDIHSLNLRLLLYFLQDLLSLLEVSPVTITGSPPHNIT